MKKIISFLMVLALLLSFPGISLAAENQSASTFKAAVDTQTILRFFVGKTTYYVNDVQRTLDVAPFIRENRTQLPIRFVAESLGATVSWDQLKQEVTIDFNGTIIKLWIGKSTALVNGASVPIDASNPKVVPIIEKSRTFIPIRFVLEALNSEVIWDSSDYSITVKYPRLATSMLAYEDSTYGFRMKYPQGWVQMSQGMYEDAIAVFGSPGEECAVYILAVDLQGSLITLDQFTTLYIDRLKQEFMDVNIIESGATTLAGSPAYKIVHTMTAEGTALKVMQIWTIKNNKVYVVMYAAEADAYSTFLGTAQEMINSFGII